MRVSFDIFNRKRGRKESKQLSFQSSTDFYVLDYSEHP
jgi:hypothetical protein